MKIKVCGLTRKQDVELAVELGAWALGFIFYEKSPRAILAGNVRKLLSEVPTNIKTVGVFVNEPISSIRKSVETSGITAVQLHGEESPEFCVTLKKELPQIEIIKAIRPKDAQDLRHFSNFLPLIQAVLLDTYSPHARGGTGQIADWTLAAQAKALGPLILAGGLNTENVQAAIEAVHPDAIDVSSGLEDAPGIKSESKMKNFFKNAQTRSA